MSQNKETFKHELDEIIGDFEEKVLKINPKYTNVLIIAFGEAPGEPVSMLSNTDREHAARAMASIVQHWEETFSQIPSKLN